MKGSSGIKKNDVALGISHNLSIATLIFVEDGLAHDGPQGAD